MSEEEEEKEQEEDEESKEQYHKQTRENSHKHLNQRPQLLQLQEDASTQEDGRRKG